MSPDKALVPEVLSSADMIRAQETAAIDIAVATAKAYPRDIDLFKNDLLKNISQWRIKIKNAAAKVLNGRKK